MPVVGALEGRQLLYKIAADQGEDAVFEAVSQQYSSLKG